MEDRRYMAAHKTSIVTGERFLGTPEGITGVVLTFNIALDPVTASITDTYQVIRKFKTDDDGFFGFGGGDGTDTDRIGLSAATYDAMANTVTLTPKSPLSLASTCAARTRSAQMPARMLSLATTCVAASHWVSGAGPRHGPMPFWPRRNPMRSPARAIARGSSSDANM